MQPAYFIGAIIVVFAALVLAQNQGYLQPIGQIPSGEIECSSDAECMPAGCSGQICVPRNKAAEIITTCEYRPEYMCLRTSASCGCVNNKCQWNKAPDYESCIAEARAKYGIERIV